MESNLSRRALLANSLILTAGSVCPPAFAISSPTGFPVTEIQSGRVRGSSVDGVNSFKGIPYGTFVSRFLPAGPVHAWSGVRDTLEFGPMAVQPKLPKADLEKALVGLPILYRTIATYSGPEAYSEGPFTLNVWAPSRPRSGKAPVMVWLHGGGFSVGTSAATCSNGESLARSENVVVVSLNHRLNTFGYLHLAHLGDDRYANSGNAGMFDIIQALQWVRDNITAFGGDPANVTICGVSGGGAKVAVLLAMPAAAKLFHKAVIQSAPYLNALTPQSAAETTDRMLRELGLNRGASAALDELASMPAERLYAAYDVVSEFSKKPAWIADWQSWNRMFAPVLDGRTLVANPFDASGLALWSAVPLLIGNTSDEFYNLFDAQFDTAGAVRRLVLLGVPAARCTALLNEVGRLRPTESAADCFYAIASHVLLKDVVSQQISAAASRGSAPTYAYRFAAGLSWKGSPRRAIHALDVPFWFDVAKAGPGEISPELDLRGQPLALKMRGAWASFARSGRPHHDLLPDWPLAGTASPRRMILDAHCVIASDDPTERLASGGPIRVRERLVRRRRRLPLGDHPFRLFDKRGSQRPAILIGCLEHSQDAALCNGCDGHEMKSCVRQCHARQDIDPCFERTPQPLRADGDRRRCRLKRVFQLKQQPLAVVLQIDVVRAFDGHGTIVAREADEHLQGEEGLKIKTKGCWSRCVAIIVNHQASCPSRLTIHGRRLKPTHNRADGADPCLGNGCYPSEKRSTSRD
jgi:para-nitrobenzyl esterase